MKLIKSSSAELSVEILPLQSLKYTGSWVKPQGHPQWLSSKESSSAGGVGLILAQEDPLEEEAWQHTPVFWPENSKNREVWQTTVYEVTESDRFITKQQ